MILTWSVVVGTCWLFWMSGGLRFYPPPSEGPVEPTGIVLAREPVHGETFDQRAADWAVADGATIREAVEGVVLSRFLPVLRGGERRWQVTIDSEPVAIVVQGWTGPQWWPEPEWLADPDARFTGRRMDFAPVDGVGAG